MKYWWRGVLGAFQVLECLAAVACVEFTIHLSEVFMMGKCR
jgi:hypothetical protein